MPVFGRRTQALQYSFPLNLFSLHFSQKTSRRQGFSLVEVVLAIGVTSFALLGMVALIPMGMKTSHQAIDAMTEAQIVQYARNELELTPFASLASSWDLATVGTAKGTLYFDNQGLPTTSTDPEMIYKVTFAVGSVQLSTLSGTATSVLTGNLNTPGATASTPAANAQLVQVSIVNRTTPGASGTAVFPIIVPNAGF